MRKHTRLNRTLGTLGVVAVLLAAVVPAGAAIITTEDGNGADTHVWKGANGTTNYGTYTNIHAQDFSATSSLLGYVRFDLPDDAQTFTSVTLDLVSTIGSTVAIGKPFYIWGLKDSQNADAWGESTITYNNAPGLTIGGGVATLDVDLTKADRLDDGTLLQVAAGSTVSFSNANLLNFLNADTDGLITLIIGAPKASSDPGFLWASKENTIYAPPTLEVEYTIIPEPSTAILAGLGLLGLSLRRRRK